MPEEQWITFPEAVEIVRDRLKCSIGRAQALVRQAKASGEVRLRPGPGWMAFDDGCMGIICDEFNKDDFLDWLNCHEPQEKKESKKPKNVPVRHRYPGDVQLIKQGQQMEAAGMTKVAAARELAPQAEGGDLKQRIERLRKLI